MILAGFTVQYFIIFGDFEAFDRTFVSFDFRHMPNSLPIKNN